MRKWDVHADVIKMNTKVQLLKIKCIIIRFREWCKLTSAFISNKACIFCSRANTVQHLAAVMNNK